MESNQDRTIDKRGTPSPFIPTGVPSLSTATANTDVNSMADASLNSGMTLDQTSTTAAAANKSLTATANPTPSALPPPSSSGTTTPAVPSASQSQTPANQSTITEKPVGPSTATQEEDNTIRNQKYVEEFQYLLEKSQSLFSGLRDLPPTGSHRQWRPYFEKTFEVYTKLWKFQQAHRSLLEEKNNYGLKRWEVGEIASKIGQLYYHYYLRTSETNYLNEAYVFYEAIHDRQYFKNILEVKNPALMIKKMRYYARFVVVCLLLNKDENIRLLISELELLIDEYTKTFKPVDAKEWQMVLQEITTFMEAEKKLVPINADRTQVPIKHRLPVQQLEKPQGLRLQEAILVGNYQNQIKFSELTLDMYRMLQSLEREPISSSSNKIGAKDLQHPRDHTSTLATEKKDANGPSNANSPTNAYSLQHDKGHHGSSKRMNPHKYLLYRPTFTQLLVYIATAFKDTGDNAVMLLYISADGCVNESSRGYGFNGGVSTSQRKTNSSTVNVSSNNPANTANNTAATPGTPSAAGTTIASNAGTGNVISGAMDSTQPPGIPLSSANITSNMNTTSGTATTIMGGNPASTSSGSKLTNTTNAATISSTGHSNVGGTGGTGSSGTSGPPNLATSAAPLAAAAAATITTTTTPIASTTSAMTASPVALAPPSIQACLYPADLIPFTRKPLFLIVDSNNSSAFQQTMPNLFDQPLMCLLSPVVYPSSIQDKSEIGSLFTLFLHTPLLGFCSVSDIGNLDQEKWDESIYKVTQLERSIGKLLLEDIDLDISIKRFMADDFLWTFIVRFVLCGIILRCHSSFKSEKSYPTSYPNIPEAIYTAPDIMALFNELTVIADVSTYFNIPLAPAAAPTPTSATTVGTSVTLPSTATSGTTSGQQIPIQQQANPPSSTSISNPSPMDTT
ncbi:hypothetical protein BCR42DRAFT_446487 [Absidia repens]|uniref:Protein SCAI n=1 Tax=Absidia repens TaxID=90262 RepID=A0A1X2IZ05_9FUNG|nr:hypothetical protein BCR42DRAFT_446487 [Absidia repens]